MNPVCSKFMQAMFIMLLVLILDVDLVCAGKVRCIEKERQTLLHFKASLVDDNGMLSSWGAEEDKLECCQWKGVGCSNQTSHIEILDIGGCYLSGKVHVSLLMELQHLKYLNLSFNYYYYEDTHFPYFFGSLRNLRYLDMSYSNFDGKIPSQFGYLSHLQYLNLRGNSLEGSVPYQLGSLSMLQYLDLGQNGLEGTLPSHLGNLSKLQYLDLSSNALEGTLPPQLGKLSSLQKLILGYNSALKFDNWNHIGGHWLPNLTSLSHLDLSGTSNLNNSTSWMQMIGKLPKLTQLVLQDCSLSDNFLLSIGHSKFKFSTSLVVFDLSWNTFTSSIIFQWVSNVSSNLLELDLSHNLLEGPMSNDFGTAMTSLWRLDLSYNGIKGGAMKYFMNMCSLRALNIHDSKLVADLSMIFHDFSTSCVRYSLKDLDLSNNQITGTLSDLSKFLSLKRLDLQENQLKGKIPESTILPSQFESLNVNSNSLEGGIPKSFGDACTLRSLSLYDNRLSEELPVIIHHLSGCARYSLQELYLHMNQINGTLPDLSIFPSLEVLNLAENRLIGKILRLPSDLKSFSVSSNSLEGVITDSIFAVMSKLKVLNLSDNSLALNFSPNWMPSFQLEVIQLRSCQLGPDFPKWLQTQNNFMHLDISNAGISDILPEWFWNLPTKLLSMNISYNNLMGTISNFSLRLANYPSISLAANQFEGPIPPFLRNVESLDLSENKFSDSFSFLCANDKDDRLGQLDLSNNHLSGQIPDCWSHFKLLLGYLDLSNNNFSGQIPASLGSALELQALILRNNSLVGELPLSLRNCTKLVMLDVGENMLSGPIPSWTGSISPHLQMLSLRKNYFFGSLPLSLCYLSSIHLLDLSSNNLKGQIPKCFKNFSAMAEESFSLDDGPSAYIVNQASGRYMYSYDLIALLMWKGVEHTIKNNKLLLKGIDLSSNQLTEEIPTEIVNLIGLVSLNLSRNNLTGEIPLKIGRLTSLEFLDLSRNQLVGSIPSSLTQIDRLTMLNLSHNYLSGEIPTGTQLQSFDASSYEYNLDLCGRPLEKLCKEDKSSQEPIAEFREHEESFFDLGFYISMALGFIIGFWGIFGSILIKRSWRNAYFRFLNNLTDNIYVMVAVKFAKYKRWLRR